MSHQAREHLQRVDPLLGAYIERIQIDDRPASHDLFGELCDTIISQQLSGKAAATIFRRFQGLFSEGRITARKLLDLPDDVIRASGASWAKVRSLKDLAQKVQDKTVRLDALASMSDDAVKKNLTQVKGIGPWSAEMFLLFGLGREDIFSYGDLGLRKGIMKVYGMKKEPTQKQIAAIVRRWSPHRSYASRILWKSLEI